MKQTEISLLFVFILWNETHDIFDCLQIWFKTNTNKTENKRKQTKNILLKTMPLTMNE